MQKDKIGAVKLIRERIPGLGLKEAKDMVDEWENKQKDLKKKLLREQMNTLTKKEIELIRDNCITMCDDHIALRLNCSKLEAMRIRLTYITKQDQLKKKLLRG